MPKDKYILISESDWENIYKVQDRIIEDLKQELKRKDVRVWVHRYSDKYFNKVYLPIGELRISIEGGCTLKDFTAQTFLNCVEETAGVKLIDSEIAQRRERVNQENVDKIKKIPKFIKWLFNIKYDSI